LVVASGDWAAAQQNNMRNVGQYLCKDVMREHGNNRDVAISFLNGFLLGKSGSQAFDIDALHTRTTDFMEYCLDHPAEKAIDAMEKVKK
jgi:hypothetical protein